MNAPVIAFFNNKGGVGKTTLVYHLAWMYADLGIRVLAGDLDPQANLSTPSWTRTAWKNSGRTASIQPRFLAPWSRCCGA